MFNILDNWFYDGNIIKKFVSISILAFIALTTFGIIVWGSWFIIGLIQQLYDNDHVFLAYVSAAGLISVIIGLAVTAMSNL